VEHPIQFLLDRLVLLVVLLVLPMLLILIVHQIEPMVAILLWLVAAHTQAALVATIRVELAEELVELVAALVIHGKTQAAVAAVRLVMLETAVMVELQQVAMLQALAALAAVAAVALALLVQEIMAYPLILELAVALAY
jgi:hypothetical protein